MNPIDDSCPDESTWNRFLDGDISDAEFTAIDQHRRKCNSCQATIDQLALLQPDSKDTCATPAGAGRALEEAERRFFEHRSEVLPEIPGYSVIELIGEGGMGVVYKARQDQPLARTVAIKVIAGRLPATRTRDRFEREINALAKFRHPNIAQIFDSGELADGRPFLAMEYIDGQTMDEFCRQRRLTVKQRLRLIVRICDGVQYAHSKLVIHRDLTPSNVLVSVADDESSEFGMPQIIDFGLAKLLGEEWDTAGQKTQHGTILGTLPYMSPEQTRSAANLDVKTDVYSIGVMCYKLVTGQLPLQTDSPSLEERLRLIRETDPLRPSECVSRTDSDEIAPLLAEVGMDQQQLVGLLRPELDLILLKALEKAPDRRYPTVAAFAADIERFLNDEPVEAKSSSGIYRARKFYRRNTIVCWLAAAACLLLLAWLKSTHSATTLARQNVQIAEANAERERVAKQVEQSLRLEEQTARQEADAARNEAVANAQSLTEAIGVIGATLDTVNPKVTQIDQDTAIPKLLSAIGTQLDQAKLGSTDAVLQLRMKAASILVDMGNFDAAIPLIKSIIQTCEQKFGESHENTDLARIHLGHVYLKYNRLQQAQDVFWEIFQRVKKSHGEDHPRTLAAALFVAGTQKAGGHYSEAVFMLEHVIEQAQSDGTAQVTLLPDARHQLGQIHFAQKEYDKATAAFRLAMEQYQSLANLPEGHPILLEIRSDLCAVLEKQARTDEAIAQRRKLVEATVRQYPTDSEPVARAKFNLAVLLSNASQHDEALQLLEETSYSQSQSDIALRSRFVRAQLLEKQGKAEDAKSLLEKLIPEMTEQLDQENSLLVSAKKILKRLTAESDAND